jgi:hypothetical protein
MRKCFCVRATRAVIFGIALCVTPTPLVWASEATAAPHPSKVFELAIANGRLAAANNTIRVKRGDYVELRWSSDRAISVHLHGYDIERRITPESPVTMAFEARLAGRFSVSEHGSSNRHAKTLLYLEVYP